METKESSGRVLAVDWGEKRLGFAVSDEAQMLSRPLGVITAKSRAINADRIAAIAKENQCAVIVIGVSYDEQGALTPSGRRGARLAGVIESITDIKVTMFDEFHSTRDAKQNQIMIGSPRTKRKGHIDDHAAAVFLQSYLDRKIENG